MKKTLSLLTAALGVSALVAFSPISESDGYYAVSKEKSSVKWTGSKITGSSHTGIVSISEGGIQLSDGKVSGGKFTIDMTTINVTDLDGSMKTKLEGHLKNEDFFNVEKFNTARLAITSVDGDNITADLTIKDKTHPITFPAKVVMDANGGMTATATIKVDRAKYDVRYGSDSFFDNLGDKTINDIIEFDVTIVASAS